MYSDGCNLDARIKAICAIAIAYKETHSQPVVCISNHHRVEIESERERESAAAAAWWAKCGVMYIYILYGCAF